MTTRDSGHCIDYQSLNELTAGNRDAGREILHMMVLELPQRRHDMAQCADTSDFATLRSHAHQLAGAAAFCAATPLRRAAEALEDMLLLRRLEDVSDQLTKVDMEIGRLLSELNSE